MKFKYRKKVQARTVRLNHVLIEFLNVNNNAEQHYVKFPANGEIALSPIEFVECYMLAKKIKECRMIQDNEGNRVNISIKI